MSQSTQRNSQMTKFLRPLAVLFLVSSLAGEAFGSESVLLPRQDRKSVPISAYAPPKGNCQGIAVISPGAGGSEDGYSYLAKSMSSQGYLAVVVGHQESGRQAVMKQVRGKGLRKGLSRLITDPEAYKGRFMDIAAARLWAKARCKGTESILLGHSMGAATAMIEAGAKNKLGIRGSNTFDAYVALSPQGVGSIFPPNAWQKISKPVLTITGTRDGELGGGSWKTRLEAFNNMPAGCKWSAVIDGATHMNFAGKGMSQQTEALTVQTIRTFLVRLRQKDCKPPQAERGIEIQTK